VVCLRATLSLGRGAGIGASPRRDHIFLDLRSRRAGSGPGTFNCSSYAFHVISQNARSSIAGVANVTNAL
jgi:hypothetical protein